MNIPPVVYFSSITLLAWGLETALLKKYSQISQGPKLIFYRNIITSLVALIALLFFFRTAVFNIKYILAGISLASVGYIGLYYYLKAFKVGRAGIISPIGNTRLLISILIAVIFLGDSLNRPQIYAVLTVLTGVIMATINFRDFKTSSLLNPNSGIKFVLLTAFVWGIVHPLYSLPSVALGAFLFTFILEFTVAFLGGLQTILSGNKLFDKNFKNILPNIVTVGLLGGIGSIFLNLAYATGEISVALTIVSAIPLVVVIFGILVYKEKFTAKEVLSIFLMLTGIVLISYSNY